MTACAIMQPTYLPWLGYFALMDMVDVFVFLDDVQLLTRSFHVRNRIKRQDGEELMLSISIRSSLSRDERLIKDVEISEGANWEAKHLKSFEHNYKKAPHFAEAMAIFEPALRSHGTNLCDFNIGLIETVAERIGIGGKRCFRSSEIADKRPDRRDRLIDLCGHAGADLYLSARGSADYLGEGEGPAQFGERGIDLLFQTYEHPAYPQINGPFRSHLCVLDLIANVGCEAAAGVIRSGIRPSVRTVDTPVKEAV
jgi:hypothetical protein